MTEFQSQDISIENDVHFTTCMGFMGGTVKMLNSTEYREFFLQNTGKGPDQEITVWDM